MVAPNSVGTTQGRDLTLVPGVAVVTTLPVTNVTMYDATTAAGTYYGSDRSFHTICGLATRLVSIPISTFGMTERNLSFRYSLDSWFPYTYLGIQSSSDGVNWTDVD